MNAATRTAPAIPTSSPAPIAAPHRRLPAPQPLQRVLLLPHVAQQLPHPRAVLACNNRHRAPRHLRVGVPHFLSCYRPRCRPGPTPSSLSVAVLPPPQPRSFPREVPPERLQ